jgi:formylglycine-generating enzyme
MKTFKKKYQVLSALALISLLVLVSYKAIVKNTFNPKDEGMVLVEGGTLETIDSQDHKDKRIKLKSFFLDKDLVTVAEFEAFAKATGYETEAERFGNAGVFDIVAAEWKMTKGANYLYPLGPEKEKAKPNHPVTQVSWNDALAYAKWKGKRLPNQWEWEWAAKNASQTQDQYSWGNKIKEDGKYKANTWQGSFPFLNTVEDGFTYTSPVGAFGRNNLGLSDMGGNVWQWCEDIEEPSMDDVEIDTATRRVTRGGSFLCDSDVCHGFKVTGRSSSTPESSMLHIGFRCAKDL